MLVPGLLGSRLKLQIDCEELQRESPDVWNACGWTSCTSWNLWGQVPQKKYTLWISDFFGPMNVVKGNSVKCWSSLINLKYVKNETEASRKFQSPRGATVTVYGQTDGSSHCGFEAVNNLLSTPMQMQFTKGYSVMKDALEHMGYQVGLTLYAAPYDWRKTTVANGIGIALKLLRGRIHIILDFKLLLIPNLLKIIDFITIINDRCNKEVSAKVNKRKIIVGMNYRLIKIICHYLKNLLSIPSKTRLSQKALF